MANQKDVPPSVAVPHAYLPPDAHWIPRLLNEFEAPFGFPDARAADCMEQGARGLFALSGMAMHPWTLLHAQWALLSLAAAHLGAVQRDWCDAWLRFIGGGTGDGVGRSS